MFLGRHKVVRDMYGRAYGRHVGIEVLFLSAVPITSNVIG